MPDSSGTPTGPMSGQPSHGEEKSGEGGKGGGGKAGVEPGKKEQRWCSVWI
jgi:hypothetical protein